MDGERQDAHLFWLTGEVNYLVPLLLCKEERRHTSMLIRIIMYIHINKSFTYLICRVLFLSRPFYLNLIFNFFFLNVSSIFSLLLSLHHHVRSAAHWPPSPNVLWPASSPAHSVPPFSWSIILSAWSTSSSLLISSRPLPRPSLYLALFYFLFGSSLSLSHGPQNRSFILPLPDPYLL